MCIWTRRRKCWISLWVRTSCSNICKRCESICCWVKATSLVCSWRVSSNYIHFQLLSQKIFQKWFLFQQTGARSSSERFVQLRVVIDIGCGTSFYQFSVWRSGNIESPWCASDEQFRRRHRLGYFLLAVHRSWTAIDHARTIHGQIFAAVQTLVAYEAFGIRTVVEDMERPSVQCKGICFDCSRCVFVLSTNSNSIVRFRFYVAWRKN